MTAVHLGRIQTAARHTPVTIESPSADLNADTGRFSTIATRSSTDMMQQEVMITNKLGLHARAAAKLVHTANTFTSEVFIGGEFEEVNAKSILGLLTLAASKGTSVSIRAEGEDEDEAVRALVELFQDKFGEGE
jgi:phosphocarrier protein